jgi:hypothetical protein
MGRRGSGSGTSGSARKTSPSFAWSLQPGSAGPVSLARSPVRVQAWLPDFASKKRSFVHVDVLLLIGGWSFACTPCVRGYPTRLLWRNKEFNGWNLEGSLNSRFNILVFY